MRRAFEFAGVDPELHLRAVRPRVGEVDRQGVRPVPADGEADQAARASVLRPQLRPPARADALDGREGRPRPRRPRGPEARRSPPRSRRTCWRSSARTPRRSRSSPAASSRAGRLRLAGCRDEDRGRSRRADRRRRRRRRGAPRRGHEPIPHGALSEDERDDWAWASEAAARDVAEGRAEQAIVCCWTGTGASIAANKVPGIRAALCPDAATAEGARQLERRQRAGDQPARDLRGRAGRDPRRVVRRGAERRGRRPRPTSSTWARSRSV